MGKQLGVCERKRESQEAREKKRELVNHKKMSIATKETEKGGFLLRRRKMASRFSIFFVQLRDKVTVSHSL